MDMQEVVAGEVRAHLARRRLSGRQAAMRLGWTEPYINRRLLGTVAFNVTDLEAIAELLDVPVTVFFEQPAGLRLVAGSGSGSRKTPNFPLIRRAA